MVKTKMKVFTIIKEKSERITDKNFVNINGNPLWWHLLSELDGLDIVVNTDSKKFINQLQNYELKTIKVVERLQKHVDWENNKDIDSSPVEDMLFDFCRSLDRSEIVVLTHVTSPFLKKETIVDAVHLLQKDPKSKSIHSVQMIQDFVWKKKDDVSSPVNFSLDRVQRTQDISPIFVSKGAFFIAKAGDILDQQKRLPQPLIFFPLDHIQSLEIDNFEDLEFARFLRGL
jgi:CMP-N-acetylneuraminic acid synthetase